MVESLGIAQSSFGERANIHIFCRLAGVKNFDRKDFTLSKTNPQEVFALDLEPRVAVDNAFRGLR